MRKKHYGIISGLKKSYIFALACIAVLASASCFILVTEIDHQESSSRVINISGRQRMLSQNIVKNVIVLNSPYHAQVRDASLAQLKENYQSWVNGHRAILYGNADMKIPKLRLSDVNKEYFSEIEPYYNSMSDISQKVLKSKGNIKVDITQLLNDEQHFLALMDQITFQFDTEAKAEVVQLRKYEITFWIVTLIALILEALFIFAPIIRLVRKYIDDYDRLFEEKQKQELQSLDAIVHAQESERQRIATELHDGVAQMLSLVKINVSSIGLSGDDIERSRQTIRTTQKLIDKITDELRTVSYNLMPSTLTNFGLLPALDEMAERMEYSDHVCLKIEKHLCRDSFGSKTDLGIYRIIQELVNNTLKHSGASKMTLQLEEKDEMLVVTFMNNGISYDPALEREKENSKGLKNVTSHARNINSAISFNTNNPGEIVITLEVPIYNN